MAGNDDVLFSSEETCEGFSNGLCSMQSFLQSSDTAPNSLRIDYSIFPQEILEPCL